MRQLKLKKERTVILSITSFVYRIYPSTVQKINFRWSIRWQCYKCRQFCKKTCSQAIILTSICFHVWDTNFYELIGILFSVDFSLEHIYQKGWGYKLKTAYLFDNVYRYCLTNPALQSKCFERLNVDMFINCTECTEKLDCWKKDFLH